MRTARLRNELSHTCAFCMEACVLPKNGNDDALLTCSKCKTSIHEKCWNDYKVRQCSLVHPTEEFDNEYFEGDLQEMRRTQYRQLCRCPSCRSTLKLAGRPRPMDDTQEAIECFDNDTSEAYLTRIPSLKRLSLQRQIKKASKNVTFWADTFERYPWIQTIEKAIEFRKKAEAELKDLQKRARQKKK